MSLRFIASASGAYAVITLAEMASSLVTMPILTRYLSLRDYGVMLFIANGAALINLLFGYSLAQALPPLYAAAQNDDARRRVTTTVTVATLAVAMPVHLAVALLAPRIAVQFLGDAAYATAIRFGALASFLTAASLTVATIMRMHERHWTYFRVQLPAVIGQLCLVIGLIAGLGLGLEGLYIATGLASLATALVFALLVWDALKGRIERGLVVETGRIALGMVPWQLATLLTLNCAGFFFARTGRLDEAGLFSVALSVSTLLAGLSSRFGQVWTPFVLNRQSMDGLEAIQQRIFRLYSAGLLVATAGVALFAREIFALLAGPDFQPGFRFVPPLAFVFAIYCFANTFAQGLQARQQTHHYAWIGAITSVVFVVAALVLARPYGAYGIIGAMAAGFLTMLVCLQVVSQRLMPVAYPWARHAVLWAVALAIVWPLHPMGIGLDAILLKAAAIAAIAALTFVFGAVTRADLQAAWGLVGRREP